MRAALALLAAALAFTSPSQEIPAGPVGAFPLSSVVAGVEATGWTVLSGRDPVPFRAVVQGVVAQDASRGPVIVCELSGQGLEDIGVLHAMSGSPLYVGDRLLGAVAFAWPFARRSLCGVTPAESLLPLLAGAAPAAGGGPSRVPTAAGLLGPSAPEGARLFGAGGTPSLGALAAAGFSWSGPAPAAPGAGGAAPPGPGQMLAAQLVAGDIEFAAFGTVTAVEGDRFVAFAHPFLHLGPVDLPVTSARVEALVPKLEVGTKLASSEEEVGALRLDAATGVSGRYGARAETLPVTLRLAGPGRPGREFRLRLARHRFLTPSLLQGALAQAQQAVEGVADPKTVALTWSAELGSGETLTLGPLRFSGPAPFGALNDFAGNVLDLLLNNAREPVAVRALTLSLATEPGLSGGELRALWPGRPAAVRGEPFPLRATFQPLSGPTRTVEVVLETASWPAGAVALWAGDAFSLLRRLSGTEALQPATASELVTYLRRIPANDRLYVAVLVPSPAAKALAGRRLDAPPPSVGSLLQGAAEAGAPPPFRLLALVPGPETGAFEGLLETEVPVRPPTP